MVQCPSCGTEIEADFGMITCENCEAVFMVDMDGAVSPPEEQASFEEAPADEFVRQETLSGHEASNEPPAEEEDYFGQSSEQEHTLVSGAAEGEDSEEPAREDENEDDYSEQFLDSLDNPTPPAPVDEKGDPLGITRFDQSSASQMLDGQYYYDVFIDGLDTAQLKQTVVRELDDARFGWSPENLLRTIRSGKLRLENLNPVKAVLVMIKLQSYDLDISWQQKLYTADSVSDAPEET